MENLTINSLFFTKGSLTLIYTEMMSHNLLMFAGTFVAFSMLFNISDATEFEAVEHASIGDHGFRLALKEFGKIAEIPPGTTRTFLSLSHTQHNIQHNTRNVYIYIYIQS